MIHTPRTLHLELIAQRNASTDSNANDGGRTYTQLLESNDERKVPPSAIRARRRALLDSGLLEDKAVPTCWTKLAIFPGTVTGSWWLEVWDLYVCLMILQLCYYEPYSFALYRAGEEPMPFVVMNKILAITFTVDMIFQFFIAWPRSEDSLHKDLWESNPWVLSKHYLGLGVHENSGRGGWFWFDLLAILPCWLGSAMENDNMANPLLMLRILRIFQSTRLHRLTKLQEFVHSKTGYHAVVFEFIKFLIITTLTCHWMACLWVMVEGKITHGIISYYTDQETWLSALIAAKGDTCQPDAKHDRLCTYLLAYYWATMTLTSVGYGDITPQNHLEYVMSVICMTVVGYIWAYIVGTIVSILASIDPENKEFKHTLDQLNSLMSRRGLPSELQVRMRQYMYETRRFSILKSQRNLVERYLSHGLQREVASQSAEVSCIMKTVWWIYDMEDEAVLDIVRVLEPVAYGSSELISIREAMIIIQKGIAGIKGRVLARGDVWGQTDILLDTPGLVDSAMPRTVSYMEILLLSKRSLVEVCRNYPRVDRRLRRAQIRSAAARAFIQAAEKIKRAKKAQRRTRAPKTSGDRRNCEPPMDDPLTSFVNPGIKANILSREVGKDVRCDLQDLRDLLMLVLKNQNSLEERVDALTEEVQNLSSLQKQPSKERSEQRKVTDILGLGTRSEPTSRATATDGQASPRTLQQWAKNTFSPRAHKSQSEEAAQKANVTFQPAPSPTDPTD